MKIYLTSHISKGLQTKIIMRKYCTAFRMAKIQTLRTSNDEDDVE
jgi:hypothetical protein